MGGFPPHPPSGSRHSPVGGLSILFLWGASPHTPLPARAILLDFLWGASPHTPLQARAILFWGASPQRGVFGRTDGQLFLCFFGLAISCLRSLIQHQFVTIGGFNTPRAEPTTMTDRIKLSVGGGIDKVDDDSKSLQNKGRRHSERGHHWSISISARCVQHHRRYYHIGIQVLDTK